MTIHPYTRRSAGQRRDTYLRIFLERFSPREFGKPGLELSVRARDRLLHYAGGKCCGSAEHVGRAAHSFWRMGGAFAPKDAIAGIEAGPDADKIRWGCSGKFIGKVHLRKVTPVADRR